MRIKSMAKPSMAFAIVAALMLGLLAGPASADKVKDKDGMDEPGDVNVKDTGVLVVGNATVGKLRDRCLHDGTSTVSGSGIGLPGQATKNAYWEIGNTGDPATLTSLFDPTKVGVLKACGRLTKMASSAGGGVGAACGSSKGWDGKGTVSFPDIPGKDTIWLKNLGWKASVTTFVVTGTANQDATEAESKAKTPADVIVAVIQAQGAAPCATKKPTMTNTDPKPNEGGGGATNFTVNGTYTISNGTLPDQSATPATCKSGAAEGCVNEPKKTGKSG